MSLRNLSDSSVLEGFTRIVRQSHAITAALLAHILEIEYRQLYRDAGCGSMRAFLIEVHHFSEDAAERRLQAAHAIRRHPDLLGHVADGRLHLTAVLVLAPHLDGDDAGELIEACAHKTRSQIQALLLTRKPVAVKCDQPEITLSSQGPALARVPDESSESEAAPLQVSPAPARVESSVPERIAKVALRESTRDLLREAHDLLAGAVPFGDHDRVIAQGLRELVDRLRKRKFAKSARPRKNPKASVSPRTISAEVRRAVAERDGGRCTFVGPGGHRCTSRAVEFDHIVPIAMGGTSTVFNVRQLCRAHNQLAAEQVFGRAFMDRKRRENDDPVHHDLVSGLRNLGYRAHEAKEAADHAMRGADLSLEQRMRAALAFLRPKRGVAHSAAPAVPAAVTFGAPTFSPPAAP